MLQSIHAEKANRAPLGYAVASQVSHTSGAFSGRLGVSTSMEGLDGYSPSRRLQLDYDPPGGLHRGDRLAGPPAAQITE